jgi:hypothetical protein
MAKRKKNVETSPQPSSEGEGGEEQAVRGSEPVEHQELPSATVESPPKDSPQIDDQEQRDISRFWSGAGLIFGIWVVAGFLGFIVLVLLSKDPPKLEPPLDRPLVEKMLGASLRESKPAAERYTKIGRQIETMLKSEQLTDETLRQELNEALGFAKQVSVPHEYWITPIWVEGTPQDLRQTIPVFRLEAQNDATTPGSRAQLSQSQPNSQPTWQKISFGTVKNASAIWAAGDPLRLRFSLRDAEGLQPTTTIGGDDLELAPDMPLPGVSMLLLGEPRALTRGQGRYLVRVRTQDGGVLVPPLLLLRALGAE